MADERVFEVAEEEAGFRLDRFLALRLPEISRSVIARLVEAGSATVEGKAATKALRLRPGQAVALILPEATAGESGVIPEQMPLAFLHEDEDIVVISKPAGICVHPAPGHADGTLVNGMLARFPAMARVGSIKRPGVVHRLDLETSGAILFALTPRAYTALTGMIRKRAIEREYLAVVHGAPSSDSGRIEIAIGRDPAHRRRFAALGPVRPGAKAAATRFEVEERLADASILRVRLETGRTHQIRVHMKAIGHPVVGDVLYAPGRPTHGIGRQALHARSLKFRHPFTGERVEIDCAVPEDIRELIARLRR